MLTSGSYSLLVTFLVFETPINILYQQRTIFFQMLINKHNGKRQRTNRLLTAVCKIPRYRY